jgi:hypothetical protein
MYIICVVFQVMGMCVDLRWPYVNVDELVVNDDELMWGRGSPTGIFFPRGGRDGEESVPVTFGGDGDED